MPAQGAPGINVALGIFADGFLGGINKAIGGLKKFTAAMSTTGKVLTGLGTALGIVAAIHVRNSIQEFIKFEQQLAGLAKVMNDFDAATVVARNIGQLSKQMPVASEAMFEVAETAARLGIRGVGNLREFTRVATMLGAATDLSATKAADAFARILKQTRTPIKQFETLGSVINELSNNMATTASEIVDSVRRSAPELARLGFTAPQISAIAASLNEVSESATRAGTRLRRLGQALGDPNKMSAFAEAIGETPDAFRRLLREDPVAIFQRIIAVFQEGGKEAQKLATVMDARVRLALAALSQNAEGTTRALKIMGEQIAGPDSLQEEFDIFADTTGARMQQVQNAVDELQRQTGRHVIFMKRQWEEFKLSVLDALSSVDEFMLFTNDLDRIREFNDRMTELAENAFRNEERLLDTAARILLAPFGRFGQTIQRGAVIDPVVERISSAMQDELKALPRFESTVTQVMMNAIEGAFEQTGDEEIAKDLASDIAESFTIISESAEKAGPRAQQRINELVGGLLKFSEKVRNGTATWEEFTEKLLTTELGVRGLEIEEAESEIVTFVESIEQKTIELQNKLTELGFGGGERGEIMRLGLEAFGEDFMDEDAVQNALEALAKLEAAQRRLDEMEAFKDRLDDIRDTNVELANQLEVMQATTPEEQRAIEHRQEMRDLEFEIGRAITARADESVIAALREQKALKQAIFAREKVLRQLEREREAREKETKEFKKRVDEALKARNRIADMGLLTEEARLDLLTRSLERMGDAAVDAFQKIIDGSEGAGQAVLQMVQDIAAEILKRQITALLFRTFLSGATTPFPRPDAVAPGDIAPPQFAKGGTMQARQLAIVGEEGPELFVPRVAGTIVPNDKVSESMGDSFSINTNFTVNAVDGADAKRVLAENRDFITGMVAESISRSRQLKKRGF